MKLLRRISVISLFALSSFTASSVLRPISAQAAIGGAAWPLFPLMIVGAALEVGAVVTGGAAIANSAAGFHERAANLWGSALGQFLLGILFLDEDNRTGTLQKVDYQQATRYGLTASEVQSYNASIDNGDLDAILEQASLELHAQSSREDARKVMQPLLNQLPNEAHSAFTKISAYLVTHQ